MIERTRYLDRLTRAERRSPVVALLGPRQCGKTTLARAYAAGREAAFFDLESAPDRSRLENPHLVLGSARGLVVLDEIQRVPELFSVLRVVVDQPNCAARFLVLGSASPSLVRGVSESLAGRVEFVELSGFGLTEIDPARRDDLWVRGGFPRSFLAESDGDSMAWRDGFIRTFLERDVPQMGINLPAPAMRRFWTMLAHYHGQTWNASELARAMGLSDKTVRSWLDVLTGTYMVRQLQPWHENLGKRQVKAPKVYLRDAGILHALLALPDRYALLGHPKVGASWEGFALEQALCVLRSDDVFFWATHGGAELDLFLQRRGRRFGVEFKFREAPRLTRSMQTSVADLELSHLWVIYPGHHRFKLDERITAVPFTDLKTLGEAFS